MNKPLNGKRAFITGGTRGIGKAIATKFRDLGATVLVSGRTGISDESSQFCFDFSRIEDIENAAKIVAENRIDILVNNAGVTAVGDFTDIPLQELERVERVNLKAPYLLSQAALPWMKARQWGRIVNMSSIFGVIARDRRAPYCITKFGLNGLTAALSVEVAQFGILVNSVCPGFIDTDLTRSVLTPDQILELISRVPAKRLGTPEEVAQLVAWLGGPENTFICGQELIIDGGYTRV